MGIKYYTMAEIRAMSDEELIKLSAERNSRNKLSTNAERAMRVRKERSGSAEWSGISRKASSFEAQEIAYKGTSGFAKKFNK